MVGEQKEGEEVMALVPFDRTRRRVETTITGESRTKQEFAKSTDIKQIVKKHTQGALQHVNPREPMYGDFSAATSLQEAMAIVDAAKAEFDQLPGEVRQLCRGNPAELMALLASEDGAQALVDAGLPVKDVKPTPDAPPFKAPPEDKAAAAAAPVAPVDPGAVAGQT